jgi:hypothetical protein
MKTLRWSILGILLFVAALPVLLTGEAKEFLALTLMWLGTVSLLLALRIAYLVARTWWR